jgi:chorismate synthase
MDSIGQIFRVTTFGESHGAAMGAVIDGCPSQLALCEDDLQRQLDRRRPGQSDLTTARAEADRVTILSGVFQGQTLGTPIALLIRNEDQRPGDYDSTAVGPRPSHADFTYFAKYGLQARSGGGRASARETAARVAAGAVAEKLLAQRWGVQIVAWVCAVGATRAAEPDHETLSRAQVDATPVRCPDVAAAEAMAAEIRSAREDGDSLGGVVSCVCRNVPPGWGEPVFGKLTANLAGALMSIPASKAVEFGSGFAAARMRGSEHNDAFVLKGSRLGTATNRSGGIQGGISNGETVFFRVAFKPPATIAKAQATADWKGQPTVLEARGRHDPCVVPRAVPIVEAMAALVLADAALLAAAVR